MRMKVNCSMLGSKRELLTNESLSEGWHRGASRFGGVSIAIKCDEWQWKRAISSQQSEFSQPFKKFLPRGGIFWSCSRNYRERESKYFDRRHKFCLPRERKGSRFSTTVVGQSELLMPLKYDIRKCIAPWNTDAKFIEFSQRSGGLCKFIALWQPWSLVRICMAAAVCLLSLAWNMGWRRRLLLREEEEEGKTKRNNPLRRSISN